MSARIFGRVGVVGDDAAHLGGGEESVLVPLGVDERARRAFIAEGECGIGAQQQVAVAARLPAMDDGTVDQVTVAGNDDS